MPLAGEIPEPTFFGDPRSLWYLALAEAWERFSCHGMQSLLVLYVITYLLLFRPSKASLPTLSCNSAACWLTAGIADPGHKQNYLPEFRRCANDCPAFRL